ncbi:Midkine [Plecturocebus cupreus]
MIEGGLGTGRRGSATSGLGRPVPSLELQEGSPEGVSPCTRPELCSPRVVDKVKKDGPGIECAEEWAWGPCTPSSKDCGVGFREGSCGAQTQRIRCRIPCNWKKEFGDPCREAAGRAVLTQAALPPADCKYKFENWGACDGGTGTKVRQGTLKKARYNAQCQETIRVTKPCTPKTKAKAKGQ